MVVHLYTLSLNEMRMLGFFFRHYEPWVSRFVIYDDGSTDGTLEYLQSKSNVEVRKKRTSSDSVVLSTIVLFNECWKESRGVADWVIVIDIDEHLHHPRLMDYLASCKRNGVTAIPALGYEMVTDRFPDENEHLANMRTWGSPWHKMCKLRIFDPNAIEEINFTPGGHRAKPTGRVVFSERDELLLLHYKHLGADYTSQRNRFLATALKQQDVRRGWGIHWHRSEEEIKQTRNELKTRLVDIAEPNYLPWRDYPQKRWWREALNHRSNRFSILRRFERWLRRRVFHVFAIKGKKSSI